MRRMTRMIARDSAGKMLVPLLGVLTVLAIRVAGVAIVLRMDEQQKRIAKEQELEQVLREKDELQSQFQELQQTKSRVEGELSRARQDLAQSQEQLQQAVEAQTRLSKSVEDREREITRLSDELTGVRDQSRQIGTQLGQIQNERQTLRQQIVELERTRQDLETKVLELSNARPTVELEKVYVTNEPAAQVQPAGTSLVPGSRASNGQIIVVNREYDFIVMNLGRTHGLAIGQEFHIVRDNQVLGRVKVEKVYDELSAAAILPESQKDRIREGDHVRAL